MQMRCFPQWRWYLDEVFVKINGKFCYLWRAVDHEGEILEAVVTANRDKVAALKLLKRIMKKYGRPRMIVTDVFGPIPPRWTKSESRIGTRSVAVSTIGRRILINRFDDENERCSGFEA